MINRRSLLLGAAAVAAAPVSACALPPRLLQDDAPKLDIVPCSGRWPAVRDYPDSGAAHAPG